MIVDDVFVPSICNFVEVCIIVDFEVRTRADEPFHQNRTGDYTQQQAAIRSGAQIISSDYYTPDMRYKKHPKKYKNYFCKFQGSDIARINTVSFSAAKIEE